MTSWPVRTAVPAEMPRLQDIYWRASLTNEGDREAVLAHADEVVLAEAQLVDGRVRVATDADGAIVGFATTLSMGDAFELEDLFVDPDWMRRGIATTLIEDAVRLARHDGVTRINVTGNTHAVSFYESVGFVFDGNVTTPWGGVGLRMHLRI